MARLLTSQVHGQDDELEEYAPGILARYQVGDQAIERVESTASGIWDHDRPDPRLPDGPMTVDWEGFLKIQGRGVLQLHAYLQGAVRITLDGKVVVDRKTDALEWVKSEPIEYTYGHHHLEVHFKQTASAARFGLYWDGDGFQLEPVPPHHLFHDPSRKPMNDATASESLIRALRCASCHTLEGFAPSAQGPALTRLASNVRREWLRDWLMDREDPNAESPAHPRNRRMPHFALDAEQIESIIEFLVTDQDSEGSKQESAKRAGDASTKPKEGSLEDGEKKAADSGGKKPNEDKKKPTVPPRTSEEIVASGERLFHSVGCLACHRMNGLGSDDPLGGGDLTRIGDKRTEDFYAKWLTDPAQLNPDHRMPIFSLTQTEIQDLSAFLATCGTRQASTTAKTEASADSTDNAKRPQRILAGRMLVEEMQCAVCHRMSAPPHAAGERHPPKIPLNASSRWDVACTSGRSKKPKQPTYALREEDQKGIQRLVASLVPSTKPSRGGEWTLREHQCLACHGRDGGQGIAPLLTAVAREKTELASRLPAMTPPSLTSVGDKLNDTALRDMVLRQGKPHRPYLDVRMPRFRLSADEVEGIVDYFTERDRIPDRRESMATRYDLAEDSRLNERDAAIEKLAGARLVTSDGFGCTSCHAIGKVEPAAAPINARGPSLSELGKRIRPEWFDRWTRNPARIVPRMEMPSVQQAVKGVLDEDLDRQLVAVWRVLNLPDFQPPRANPVRIVRHTGLDASTARAAILTDVMKDGSITWIKPLLVGLPNRHNFLIDLERNRWSGWWIGDTARQYAEGKTWFWEPNPVRFDGLPDTATDFEARIGKTWLQPQAQGQFATELQAFEHQGQGVEWVHSLRFQPSDAPAFQIRIRQSIKPTSYPENAGKSGIARTIEVEEVPNHVDLRMSIASLDTATLMDGEDGKGIRIKGPLPGAVRILDSIAQPLKPFDARVVGIEPQRDARGVYRIQIAYEADLVPDPLPTPSPSPAPPSAVELNVAPGWEAVQLPLSGEFMPTGLAWRDDGSLVMSSLKGDVWILRDTDHDGLEDQAKVFSDELAAPYGVATGPGFVDVINKYALLRLVDVDGDDRADRTLTIASGWGHTVDYHDWAIGLPRDAAGNYYLGIPCQQDERSEAAAKYRGTVLRLKPREPSGDDPRLFAIEPISAGHRFPMGIAMNRDEQLFVTDNQGNFNPFNELNHVIQGKRYGFINALERKDKAFNPPLTEPAIDIPHPWTRSVNGIAFLETPGEKTGEHGETGFGPWEGHLVGCEYDTRRLIRMSLEQVEGTYQGAAYPFTYDQPIEGPPLLGPVVCAVAPDGDLYVGSLRDSGWGGANNIGSLTRLRPRGKLPAGIAEVSAQQDGFAIRFATPVARELAIDTKRYQIESYRRVSTPAYGGPDVDRRTEVIDSIELSEDRQSARLKLREMREGFVYSIQLRSLVPEGEEFFPAEAHYTLRRIPPR